MLNRTDKKVTEVNVQGTNAVLVAETSFAALPIPEADGYEFKSQAAETPDKWYGSRLAAIDPKTQFVCFLVRPDSYRIFQRARNLAWIKNINVACELQDEKNPIMIGPGGERMYMQ